MTSETLSIISTVAFVLAIILAIAAAVIFFVFDIRGVFGKLSGRTQAKQIEEIRKSRGTQSSRGRTNRKPRTNSSSARSTGAQPSVPVDAQSTVKIQNTVPQMQYGGRENSRTEDLVPAGEETALLNNSVDETVVLTQASQETVLLNQPQDETVLLNQPKASDETELLSQGDETMLLTPENKPAPKAGAQGVMLTDAKTFIE